MASNAYAWTFRSKGTQDAKTLLSVLEKLDKILVGLSRRERRSAQVFDKLGDVFAKAEANLKSLSSAMNKYKTTLSSVLSLNEDLIKNIDKSAKSSAKFSVNVDQSSNVVNKFSTRIDNSTKNQQKYDNRVDRSIKTVNHFGRATKAAGSKLASFARRLTRAAGVWNTWNKAVSFAGKRLRQLKNFMTGWEGTLRRVGGAFERSEATLRVLASSAGSSAKDIDALVGTVKTLGRETEFTAGQAAQGAITLLKAGNDASTSANKLESALEGALATGLDFAKAAKIGNYAWNIFQKNLGRTGGLTKDYSTALKIMIASANSADVTVTQLAGSLTNGGNILADLGVSLTRTTTALGLMANRGIVGRKAMRLLAISVKRMVDGTIPAAKALKELGVTATDPSGQLKDLGVLMEELGQKLDLRAPNEQVRIMKGLFGAGDKVMRTLLDAGITGFNELESSIEGSLGTMTQLKEARVDTIVGAWKQFRSAVEGVWVELVAVLRVPVIEYWSTLTSILRAVAERVEMLGKRFKEQGGDLTKWINLIKTEGLRGLFGGLPEELAPELDKLAQLWEAFTIGVGALLSEVWQALMTPAVLGLFKKFAASIGKAIVAGIKAGIGEERFESILRALEKMAEIANKIFGRDETVRGAGDFSRAAPGGGGETSGAGASGGWETAADKAKDARTEIEKSEQMIEDHFRELADLKAAQAALATQTTDSNSQQGRSLERQAIAEEKIVGIKRKQNEDQLKLYEAQIRYNEQIEKSQNILNETNVAINKIGESFEKWLLNPVDQFQQKILGAKEKFGSLIDGLKMKKIDLEEKFGLKTTEETARKREKLAEAALKRDEKLIKLAQTPEERARIQERMAGRATAFAEKEEGPEQQKYAKRAQKFLEQAAKSSAEAEDIEIKRVEISRDYAKKNIAEYEAMVGNAETAGGRAAALELTQQAYQTLGPDYAEQATRATEELKISRAEAASETAERQQQMAENSQRQVELLQQMVELAEGEITATRTQVQIPQNPEYGAAPGV